MARTLPAVASTLAKLTRPLGFRGIGRLFGPLSRFEPFRSAEGRAELSRGRTILFPAFDYYWAQFLWTSRPYEEDVAAVFDAIDPGRRKLFIDCGANIGYWTVVLSDPRYGYERFIAIEANAGVHAFLARNMALNRIIGEPLLAAVAERAGDTVFLDAARGHAVGSITESGNVPVTTVSIASILRDLKLAGGARPLAVVKLDVEGSEIDGVKGALAQDVADLLFVYEDWPRSGMTVSQFLLGSGFSIIGVRPDGERQRLRTLEAVFAFNKAGSAGYGPSNLLAALSPEQFLKPSPRV